MKKSDEALPYQPPGLPPGSVRLGSAKAGRPPKVKEPDAIEIPKSSRKMHRMSKVEEQLEQLRSALVQHPNGSECVQLAEATRKIEALTKTVDELRSLSQFGEATREFAQGVVVPAPIENEGAKESALVGREISELQKQAGREGGAQGAQYGQFGGRPKSACILIYLSFILLVCWFHWFYFNLCQVRLWTQVFRLGLQRLWHLSGRMLRWLKNGSSFNSSGLSWRRRASARMTLPKRSLRT